VYGSAVIARAQAADLIRLYLQDFLAPRLREATASYCAKYVHAHLLTRYRRWRYGFPGSHLDAAKEMVDWEVGHLIALMPDGVNTPSVAPLALALEPILRRVNPSGFAGTGGRDALAVVLSHSNDDLDYALHKLLRLRAEQGCQFFWKKEHFAEARILRGIKRACKSRSDLRIVHDPRGQLLLGARTDMSKPFFHAETLTHGALSSREIFGIRALLDRMAATLVRCEDHGGYCYLVDLARTVAALRRQWLAREWGGRGSRLADDDWLSVGGLPGKVWEEKVHAGLVALAEEILRNQRDDPPAEYERAWIAAAVEMIERDWRSEQTEWSELPLRALLPEILGTAWKAETAAFHAQKVNYLIRRVRNAWGLPVERSGEGQAGGGRA